MSFTSYAKARGFDPIQIPSETILKNILQQQKFVGENMKENHRLQREFAASWFNTLQKNNSIQVQTLRASNNFNAKERARIAEAHLLALKESQVSRKSHNPQSKDAIVDKLGSLLELIPQALAPIKAWKEKQNQQEFAEGLSLIDQLGATPEQIGNLRALEQDLFQSQQGYIAAAQEILPHASEQDINSVRNATGWAHLGQIKSALGNSIPVYHQELLNSVRTKYPVKGDQDMSLAEARSSGNVSAANVILSQIQRNFAAKQFQQLGIDSPEPAMASEYFNSLKKVTNAVYNDIHRKAEAQAFNVNRQIDQVQTINALKKGGLKAWNDDVIELYRDPNNKNWRLNALNNQFPYVLDYLKQTSVSISEAEDMLTATREDGKTPFLGAGRKSEIRKIISEKIRVQDQVREGMVKQKDLAVDVAKLKILEGVRAQGLNNEGIQQLWQEYSHIAELREFIQSLIVDPVPPSQNKLEAARLELLHSKGELTTQAVLQSKTNSETKLRYLGQKGIDRPFPQQSTNLKSDIQALILQKMKIQSYEQLGAKEPSVRMATDDITSKAVKRFISQMNEGTISEDAAYQEALSYGKSFVEGLEAVPFDLDNPNSGYIEGYTVDANDKPISTESRKSRRKLMSNDTYFYKNTPLDVKQDYEYLRQKLLSGGNYDTIINDKFSWVRDVVGMYNGRVTKEEILTDNAKVLGVNLVFPKAITGEPSNMTPGALRQWRANARTLDSKLGNISQNIIQQNEQRGWRSADTMSRYTPQARTLARALKKQESGNPSAVNVHSGASGMYQIMPANIPGWSREALGREVSHSEYMSNPVIQEQIAMFHINKALQHQIAAGYKGDLAIRRAASIWYSGSAGLYDDTRDQSRGDTYYPTIQEYTLSILGKYKALAGGQ